MCVYCNMGDSWFRHDQPWKRQDYPELPPSVPMPLSPAQILPDWNLEKLKEYLKLLKEVREMEEKLGCPCEPNKADYIGLFEKRIAELEKRAKRASKDGRK